MTTESTTLRPLRYRVAGRLGASVADQALASVSNLAMSVVIASQVSLSEFGAYGLVFATYLLIQGGARASIGEALLVKRSEAPGLDARAVFGAGILVGLLGAAVSGLVAIVLDGSLQRAFAALSVVILFAVTQDCVRYLGFAELRPMRAMIADTIWCVVQFSGYAVLIATGAATLVSLMLVWGLGALCSLAYQVNCYRARPSFGDAASWIVERRDLSPRFLMEYFTMAGVQQGSIFILGIAAGLDQVGGYRAAQVILGPVNVIAFGAAVVVLPLAAQRAHALRPDVMKFSLVVSLSLAAITVTYVGMSLLVPDVLGELALGQSWSLGASLVVLVGATIAINNLSYGATSMIRGMHQARASLLMRVAFAPITITAAALGAVHGGAKGMAGVLVATCALQCVGWWLLLNRLVHVRDRQAKMLDKPNADMVTEGC